MMAAEESTKEWLEQEGFSVEFVPTADDSRPDLIARCGDETYIIEIKEKYPDFDRIAERIRCTSENVAATWTDSLEHNKRVSGVVRKASKQLSALQGTFRLVWLYAMGPDPDLQVEQFVSTLYGKATVIDWGIPDGQRDDRKVDWSCYYFSDSDFYRHRAVVDGAVIARPGEAMLCVNDVAPQYEMFLRSRIAATFEGAILDPGALEASGANIMVVRGAVDRRDESAVYRYLIDRYGCKQPLRMPMQQISAATVLRGNGGR